MSEKGTNSNTLAFDSMISAFRQESLKIAAQLENNRNYIDNKLAKIDEWKDTSNDEIIRSSILLQDIQKDINSICSWQREFIYKISKIETELENIKNGNSKDKTEERIKKLEEWRFIQVGIGIALGVMGSILYLIIQGFMNNALK